MTVTEPPGTQPGPDDPDRRPDPRPPAGEADLYDRVRETPIGKSIWRTPRRKTPRDRAAGHWASFVLHIYPVKMKKSEIRFTATWYLGIISTVLLGSLIVSGIYLMFFYVPSPDQAYSDIQTIQTEVAFGQYIRNVHRWSAHLMVLAVVAHMAACLLPRRLQGTPRVQLGHRGRVVGTDAADVLHRLPAAVGSAGVLGDRGRHRDGGVRADHRRHRPRDAPRRTHRRCRPRCCGSTCSTSPCCPP